MLRNVVLALTILALFTMFTGEIGDADTWIHLRTGQWMVEHHQLRSPTRSRGPRTSAIPSTRRIRHARSQPEARMAGPGDLVSLYGPRAGRSEWCCSARCA